MNNLAKKKYSARKEQFGKKDGLAKRTFWLKITIWPKIFLFFKMDGESVKIRKLCHLIESERITYDYFEQIVRQISNKSRPTWRRESPLVSSAKKGRQDFVEHLIEVEKFDVNSRCSDPVNWCPLAAAIANRHYEMARVLVLRYKAGKSQAEVLPRYNRRKQMQKSRIAFSLNKLSFQKNVK